MSYVLVVSHDVTEERDRYEELTRRALYDPLTGLVNRATALAYIERALGRRGRTSTSEAVIFIDLDQFKAINDSLGHAAGDERRSAAVEQQGDESVEAVLGRVGQRREPATSGLQRRTRLDEHAGGPDVLVGDRTVQGGPVVGSGDLHVGAALEEQCERLVVAVLGRDHERRPVVVAAPVDVGSGLDEGLGDIGVARLSGDQEGSPSLPVLGDVRILPGGDQPQDLVEVLVEGRDHEGRVLGPLTGSVDRDEVG